MKLKDLGYDRKSYKTTIDSISWVLETVLNGNDNGPNLVPVKLTNDGLLDIDHYHGTILSPARYLKTIQGVVVPGLLYHGLVDVKQCFHMTDKGMEFNGLYFDLSKMAVALHTHSMGKNTIEDVREAAAVELELRHDAILNRHAGPLLRGAATFDPRLAENEVGISLPMAEEFAKILSVPSVNGLHILVLRFPVIGRESIQKMIIRIIDDPMLSIRIFDGTIKRMGGDFDGDQLMITIRDSMPLEFTKGLTVIPPMVDPKHFEDMTWTLFNVKAFSWPDQVTSASGMTAKYLQGIITNFFKRIGLAAHALYCEQKGK